MRTMGSRYLITPPGECWGGDPLPPLVDWARHRAIFGARGLEVDVRLVPPQSRHLAAITAALQVARDRQVELVVVGASALWHSTLERLGLDTLGLRWIPSPLPTRRTGACHSLGIADFLQARSGR